LQKYHFILHVVIVVTRYHGTKVFLIDQMSLFKVLWG